MGGRHDRHTGLAQISCGKWERARFWKREFENHFGFRLRTRDHSWIEGSIYLIESGKSVQPGAAPIFEHGQVGWVLKLDRMLLLVKSRANDDGRH